MLLTIAIWLMIMRISETFANYPTLQCTLSNIDICGESYIKFSSDTSRLFIATGAQELGALTLTASGCVKSSESPLCCSCYFIPTCSSSHSVHALPQRVTSSVCVAPSQSKSRRQEFMPLISSSAEYTST